MLDCKLCGETCYTTYVCSSCNRIKDMINLYSRDIVLETLEKVLVRTEKQRNHKLILTDESYVKPQTRNSTKKDEK